MSPRARRRLLALALGVLLVVGLLMGGNAWAVSQGFGKGLVMDNLSVPADVGWRWLPDQHVQSTHGFPLDINNCGLRDPRDIAVPKPAGTYRVLCVGDSFTYGLATSYEQTYVHRFEESLAGVLPGRAVEVWNCGVNGWNSCQEEAWLRTYGLPLQPDLVVIGFVMNDMLPLTEEMMPASFPGRAWMLRFPLYQWLRQVVVQRQKLEGGGAVSAELRRFIKQYQGQIQLSPSSSETARKLWDEALGCLGHFAQDCAGAGIPCVLMVFPSLPQMQAPDPLPEPQRVLADLAREQPCLLVDLLPRYAAAGEAALLESDKAHPSVLGHAIAAEELLAALLRAGTLPIGAASAAGATGGGR